MTTRVLGVDPGSQITGYGILEPSNGRPPHLVECGIIRTNPKHHLPERLHTIHDGLTQLIQRHRPDTLAVEDIFYAKNVRTTMVLGHARGAILLAAAQAGIEVVEFAPATVKKTIVGAGAARKHQIGFMVQRLLNLESPPSPADAADGVAVALTYLMTRSPV